MKLAHTLLAAAALASVCAGGAFANEPTQVSPWPPVSIDRHAPGNWPVAHPAPGVNLNTIPSGIVFRKLPLTQRKAVQTGLARVGYYDGPIDGIWGVMTWAGTQAYADVLGQGRDLDDVHGSLRIFQHISH